MAEEYDAAQERGEIRQNSERSFSNTEKVGGAEVLPPKELHEARKLSVFSEAQHSQLAQMIRDRRCSTCESVGLYPQIVWSVDGEALHDVSQRKELGAV